jgi:hypothetical protein
MLKKICLVLFVSLTATHFIPARSSSFQSDALASNTCVSCHASALTPAEMSNRYVEWHASAHRRGGVGCEKCHGGDPTAKDKERSHRGMLPAEELESKLHQWNLAETCGSCHKQVVKSFVDSTHHQRLKNAGFGPSCNTCHAHMASAVIYSSVELARMCAHCHDTINGMIPRRPDIPQRAKESLEAIKRADYMVEWARGLIEEGLRRKIDVAAQQNDMKSINAAIGEVKSDWHTFEVQRVRARADLVFDKAKEVKDQMMKKLGLAL